MTGCVASQMSILVQLGAPTAWVQARIGAVALGDKHRMARVVALATGWTRQPGASIPASVWWVLRRQGRLRVAGLAPRPHPTRKRLIASVCIRPGCAVTRAGGGFVYCVNLLKASVHLASQSQDPQCCKKGPARMGRGF